jgi:hypothetical protein
MKGAVEGNPPAQGYVLDTVTYQDTLVLLAVDTFRYVRDSDLTVIPHVALVPKETTWVYDSTFGYKLNFTVAPAVDWYAAQSGSLVIYKIYQRPASEPVANIAGYALDKNVPAQYKARKCIYNGMVVQADDKITDIPSTRILGTYYYKIAAIVGDAQFPLISTPGVMGSDSVYFISGGMEGAMSPADTNGLPVYLSAASKLIINNDSSQTSLRDIQLKFSVATYDKVAIFDVTQKKTPADSIFQKGLLFADSLGITPGSVAAKDSVLGLAADGTISIRHTLNPGFGTKWVYVKLFSAVGLQDIIISASIDVRQSKASLSIVEKGSRVTTVRGKKFAWGLDIPFFYDAKNDPTAPETVWVWLITSTAAAHVRDTNSGAYVSPIGNNKSGLKSFYETEPQMFIADSSGKIDSFYHIDTAAVCSNSSDLEYANELVGAKGSYLNGLPGSVNGISASSRVRVNGFTTAKLYFLSNEEAIGYRPSWYGKKEFVLVAYSKGKAFEENRITFSDLASRSSCFWDKYPPAINWNERFATVDNLGGFAPQNQQEKLIAPAYIAPKDSNQGWFSLANLSQYGELPIALANGDINSNTVIDFSAIDFGAGLIKSIVLKIDFSKNFLDSNYDNSQTQVFNVTEASNFLPNRDFQARGIRFTPVNVTLFRKGVYRIWVETEDNLGNKGIAPTHDDAGNRGKYGDNPRYIYVDNGIE